MKNKVIIIAVIVAFIAFVLVSAYHSNDPGSSANNTTTDTNATTKNINFSDASLINNGVTSDQLNNMEQVLGQYLKSQNKSPDKVSFSSPQRQPTDPNTTIPFSEITFMVQLDGQNTYKAKLDSFSLSEIRLYLYTPDGQTLLYDSQNVGGSSGQT
ncbi:MAG TPA: hypothetical protein VHA05_02160 [Candidatus Saccharimonadales bacterium]|nr:hypothetical protein [Candidatus Saccharimonadales bacterium]